MGSSYWKFNRNNHHVDNFRFFLMKNPPYKAKHLHDRTWVFGKPFDVFKYGKVVPHIQFGKYAYEHKSYYGHPIDSSTLCRNTYTFVLNGPLFENDIVSDETNKWIVEYFPQNCCFALRSVSNNKVKEFSALACTGSGNGKITFTDLVKVGNKFD